MEYRGNGEIVDALDDDAIIADSNNGNSDISNNSSHTLIHDGNISISTAYESFDDHCNSIISECQDIGIIISPNYTVKDHGRLQSSCLVSYICEIAIDNIIYRLKLGNTSTYTDNAIYHQLYRYYGPTTIVVTIKKRMCYTVDVVVATKIMYLHELISYQRRNIDRDVFMNTWGYTCDIQMSNLCRNSSSNSSRSNVSMKAKLPSKERYSIVTSSSTNDGSCDTNGGIILNVTFLIFTLDTLVSPVTRHGRSNLHSILSSVNNTKLIVSLLKYLASQDVGMIRYSFSIKDHNGFNIFNYTLLRGNKHNTKLMLVRLGPLCFQNVVRNQSCCLHYSIIGNNYKCFHVLVRFLKLYANSSSAITAEWAATFDEMIEWRDENGNTPLLLATMLSNSENSNDYSSNNDMIIRYLTYVCRSSMNTINNKGETPLMLACKNGSINVVKYLLSFKITEQMYINKSRLNSSNTSNNDVYNRQITVKKQCLYDCEPYLFDSNGDNALLHAATNNHNSIVHYLINCIEVDYTASNRYSGNTIFHIASMKNNIELYDTLLIGVELKHWCRYLLHDSNEVHSKVYFVKNLYHKNLYGLSPIDIALRNDYIELYNKLLHYAANVLYMKGSTENSNATTIRSEDIDVNVTDVESHSRDIADDLDYSFALASSSTQSF